MATKSDHLLISITSDKNTEFSEWYRQVLIKSELIDYTDVSGCYVMRPTAYSMWEKIQKYINDRIEKLGVENCYFPLFISKKALETEKDHIEGFAPEVAWVDRVGESKIEEPIALRPTSECAIYPHFSNWIKSYRDLPKKVNQWCNIVRYEIKTVLPFIRSREFLWQEGHTAFRDVATADKEVLDILNMYESTYKDLLAVPTIKGVKSEREKFAGGSYTTTVECFIPVVGKAVQGATSHSLGQNFSKMFNIMIETETGDKEYVYQNSWGFTTRSIGVAIMIHSDNKGLVLPPPVAPLKVVIVACGMNAKTTPEVREKVYNTCEYICNVLNDQSIKTKIDTRDTYSSGYKYNYWEQRGVPIRIEIGPKDVEKEAMILVRRDTGAKQSSTMNNFVNDIDQCLTDIHNNLYNKAVAERNASIILCTNMDNYVKIITDKKLCLCPWCERVDCEEAIVAFGKKAELTTKSLCIPFDQTIASTLTGDTNQTIKHNTRCFACDLLAKSYTLFGSSY